MRIVIDSLIGLMLIAVLVGVVVLNRGRERDERDVAAVQSALERLHEQAAYHNTVQSAMAGHQTLLVHIHEEWFGGDRPSNVLLDDSHPWIDLAPPGDLGTHPPDPVATEPGQAGFWYNPTTGVFRARVTPRDSEALTLALYNQINGTSLEAFEQIPDPARKPVAHQLGLTPATQYASMANLTWTEPEPEDNLARDLAPLVEEIKAQARAQIQDQPRDQAGVKPGTQSDTGNQAQTHAASEDEGAGQADTDPLDGDEVSQPAVADHPADRPTLKK